VCVSVRGVPVVGVVHNPFDKTTVWGWVSHGMSSNLLDVQSPADEEVHTPYRVVVSRSHAGTVKKRLKQMFGDKALTISAGGAGYKVLEVLRRRADVYLHTTRIKKWDVCAGNALVSAAGGRMTTLTGETIDYSEKESAVIEDGLIATAGHRVDSLHDLFLNRWTESAVML